ncbi:bifunctional lytic transglycosylase/C40 family peptidase [Streptomyces sp. NBC_00237]|uniref:C40 family peptidase n=1 Tax=Streptomyces sp. NBC_00237 TaxID=2975687 RepID=UPI00225A5C5C|nr:bifunctional lytic transglycosylase/C40 family peptidase [Streptomyces sp. NBC_00237]MCX5206914.1 bifunctional lytic transglycosylase/C40 family peptidase [Streptomyces sp. NBC_00237]
MSAPARAAGGIGCAVVALPLLALLVITAAVGSLFPGGGGASAAPSAHATADIPAPMLALYQRAAPECPGLSWTVLAAIGKVETNHGRHPTMISSAGAVGPMQFLPSTFPLYAYPVPPGGKKPPTPWDPVDAVFAAARLLCANGAQDGKNLRRAIWHYNHSNAYVNQVLKIADEYASQVAPPTGAAGTAVAFARAQLGTPYVWGGDGPAEGGFDCSGLTKAAYAAAGITLPRVANDQYQATPKIPAGQPLLPGDLVFYGTPGRIHHVGLYIGNNQMINAPNRHSLVRVEDYRWKDYYAATRPTARGATQ